MKIAQLYSLYTKYYIVDTDTRSIRKNTIFFSLKGANFNGNMFANHALKKGASFAIIDEKKYKINNKTILVKNVLETLQKLANFHRKKLNVPIISITGSNGKTTTKELINAVLSKKFNTVCTLGNLNNHIGVPLTLLSMTPKTEIGIVEMGANHPKEIAFLCKIVEPDYGYITNFGKAHLEGFGNLRGVIKAKSELYTYLKNNHKIVFVNTSDSIQVKKTEKMNQVFFDNRILLKNTNPFVSVFYKKNTIQSSLIGSYNFNNIVAAITVGKYFKVTTIDIINAIENYIPKNNRSQIIKTENNSIILDAYNANPSSVNVALESFSFSKYKAKTIILGDMFELGKNSLLEHQLIVNLINEYSFDSVFLVGKTFYKTDSTFLKFKTVDNLKIFLQKNPITNQTILIKGSRVMALEKLLAVIN